MGGSIRRSGDRAVGLPFPHKQVSKIKRVLYGLFRLFQRDALRSPELVIKFGHSSMLMVRRAVVEYIDAVQICSGPGRQ